MNAICLTMLRGSLLDHPEEIYRPDLPALERDFDTVCGRFRRGDAAEWRAARQLPDHLERFDLHRPRDLSGRVAAGDQHALNVRRLDHVAYDDAEVVAGATVAR